MDKKIRISYYEPSDELNIFLGEARDSVLSEIDDEIYIRLDPKTNEILGFTILNFHHRISQKVETLPIIGDFAFPPEKVASGEKL